MALARARAAAAAAERTVAELRAEVQAIRAEADAARTVAARLSSSSAVSTTAAAAAYYDEQGSWGMDIGSHANNSGYDDGNANARSVVVEGASSAQYSQSAAAGAAATSHAEAEGLRVALTQARSDARRHTVGRHTAHRYQFIEQSQNR